MTNRVFPVLALLAALGVLAGCSGGLQPQGVNASDYHLAGGQGAQGSMLSGGQGNGGLLGSIFGTNKAPAANQGVGGAIGVNAYLWRGALDTLSFMPLQSADPFGGVIITDWYSPPDSPGERFKATAYILGRELRADALRVTIFRQVLENGQWVDQPVSPVTVGDIENKVLERARQLRIQTASQ